MSSENKSGSVWAVAVVFLILSWLTVGLRVYVRAEQIGKFGIDDKLIIISQIFFTAYLICQMGGAAFGTGQHIANLEYSRAEIALRVSIEQAALFLCAGWLITSFAQFWFFCEVWYAITSTTVKISICMSLRRVTVNTYHVLLIYGLIIWSVALGLAFLLGIIFQCTPASDWWDLNPEHKHCLNSHTITSLTYAVSALNVACDWTLGIFPFFIVKDLSIPIYQKILVASILAFGALGSTATIVRVVYVSSLAETYLGWNGDFLYDTTPVAIWTTVEIGVGITASCLSTLRPLFKKTLWFLRSSEHSSHRRGYSRSRRLSDDHLPIPLGHTERRNSANYPSQDGVYHEDSYAGVSQFNTTKAISSRDDDSTYMTSPPPQVRYANGTSFNMTKALRDSYGEDEEDAHLSGSAFRRHGPP